MTKGVRQGGILSLMLFNIDIDGLSDSLVKSTIASLTIGKGNGSGLVLLDLSAAFDTIGHESLFNNLEKYVGISGVALK